MKQLLAVAPSKPTEIMENTPLCCIGAKGHIDGRRRGGAVRRGRGQAGTGRGADRDGDGDGGRGMEGRRRGLYANRTETGANVS